MDMYDFGSSDDKEQIQNNSSSGGYKTVAETLSTDNDRPDNKKSKTIKKNYEPIRDGNICIRYEDDPAQYKKLRKKIQNRESAARVRGRKKGTMEGLEVQVEQLKKINSELMLRNATLETENRSLKNQIQFLRGIVKPVNKPNQVQHDSIDKYLNLSPNQKQIQMKPEQHFQSPFEQQDSPLNWVRSSYSAGSRSNWGTIFILTIVVCIFVLPSSPQDKTIAAKKIGESEILQNEPIIQEILKYIKILSKYLILLGYSLFAGSFIYTKFYKKKLKNI